METMIGPVGEQAFILGEGRLGARSRGPGTTVLVSSESGPTRRPGGRDRSDTGTVGDLDRPWCLSGGLLDSHGRRRKI